MINLRKAKTNDCRFLYELRNHPDVRNACFETSEIKYADHEKWYADSLGNPNRTILIGEIDNKTIGMVRFDLKEDVSTVSVAVMPGSQKKGIGTEMLDSACEKYFKNTHVYAISAEIKKSNIPSFKAFSKAGFVLYKDGEEIEMRRYKPSKCRLGLKIYSTNSEAFPKLIEFIEKRIIDYIELYIVPGSDIHELDVLKGLPLILHAPNYNHSFSITNKDSVYSKSIKTINQIMGLFNEKRIIFHPGYIADTGRDNISNLIKTLKELDYDIIIENVPKNGYNGDVELVASTPAEFKRIVKEAGVKFCLDLGHAIAAANTHNEDPVSYIKKFIELRPYMYHLSDGVYKEEFDTHIDLGQGDYPLKEIVSLLPHDATISLETPKNDFSELTEDLKNLDYLKTLL